ncbi:MAG: hypothetical protein HXS50_03570, partial [Theionarchaea archaeon]|nr:hypothetical protein [Theionarchaea archaeon]
MKGVAIIIIGLLLLVPVLGSDKIRIVAVGMVVPGSSPIPSWMSIEPGVSATLVPNRYAVGVFEPKEAERVVRIYFPRT